MLVLLLVNSDAIKSCFFSQEMTSSERCHSFVGHRTETLLSGITAYQAAWSVIEPGNRGIMGKKGPIFRLREKNYISR